MTPPYLTADRRRDSPIRNKPHMQAQRIAAGRPVHRCGRAEIAARIAAELEAVILSRQVSDFVMEPDANLYYVRSECSDADHRAARGKNLRHRLHCHLQIGDDAGLAGFHHADFLAFAADGHAVHDLHLAGAALAGPAIVRHINAVAQGGV